MPQSNETEGDRRGRLMADLAQLTPIELERELPQAALVLID